MVRGREGKGWSGAEVIEGKMCNASLCGTNKVILQPLSYERTRSF